MIESDAGLDEAKAIHHREEATRLLEKATELADEGSFDGAEILLSLSCEHMAHHQLITREAHFDEMKIAAQEALLSLNDPAGPHGPGCHCDD